MCLIAFAVDAHPEHALVVAANRDELYARPTAPAGWWEDAPGLLAGRDQRAGGTWMGVTRGGRFAAVTNYREREATPAGAPSRGHLVGGFLRADAPADAWLAGLHPRAGDFAGFNLLAGGPEGLHYLSNRSGQAPRPLEPGVYALSNALLTTPWPKTERAREALAAVLDGPADDLEPALFRLLAERDPAPDHRLPATGMGTERERALSSIFIATPAYGTRSSTVLRVGRDGRVRFTERRIDPAAGAWTEARFEFALDGSSGAPALAGGRVPAAAERAG